MKKLAVLVCFLCAATLVTAQARKSAPVAGAPSAAKICDEPYQVRESADGWPQGPVYILFHREKSKAPWARNPAIKVTGLEAATPAGAHTLACVGETRLEMGKYESGESGYTPTWSVTLVRLSDRKVYFLRVGFDGESPPGVKFHRGAGVGKAPIQPFVNWLRLILDQKVAHFKMHLQHKEYADPSALAFSQDGSKLVMAQEPRSTGSGTPPTPITIFDLTSGKALAVLHTDYTVHEVAISKSGNLVAVGRYGRRVEVWDVASARVVHKFETPAIESLLFAPDDELAVAGGDQAKLWEVGSRRQNRFDKGSTFRLSPAGTRLVGVDAGKAIIFQALGFTDVLQLVPR